MIYKDGDRFYKVSKDSPKGFPDLRIAVTGTDPNELTGGAVCPKQLQKFERVKINDLPEEWRKAFKVRKKRKKKKPEAQPVQPVQPVEPEVVTPVVYHSPLVHTILTITVPSLIFLVALKLVLGV